MKKPVDLLAIVVVFLASVIMLGNVSALPAHASWNPVPILSELEQALQSKGLLLREDISINLSNSPVAAGFSRPDCQGLLLMAPMPSTAQDWGHMAPLLDLSAFRVSYLYQGVLLDKPPVIERFLDSGKALFNTEPQGLSRLVQAVAEAGDCELAETALDALAGI